MRTRAVIAVVVAGLGACAGASGGSGGTSANWSGYAAVGGGFSAVRGSWAQPAARCFGGSTRRGEAAFWVGLGGNDPLSTRVEQIGTEADCNPDGSASYYAWYELWPSGTVVIGLHVAPGDRLAASVKVEDHAVILRLRNLTTGRAFVKFRRMPSPDVSSAEWIAEAPTVIGSRGPEIVPLADFGTLRFTNAAATGVDGHTGSISDPAWRFSAIAFESRAVAGRGPDVRRSDPAGAAYGYPTALTHSGRSFSVTWRHGAPRGRSAGRAASG